MIIFDLSCANEHRFEGWFASRAEFDRQQAGGLISCPSCNSTEIRLIPSAVHVGSGSHQEQPSPPTLPRAPNRVALPGQQPLAVLRQLVNALAATSEDVGTRFAEEARRIHYEEAPARSIRGQATAEERASLQEEGIDVIPIPTLPTADDLS